MKYIKKFEKKLSEFLEKNLDLTDNSVYIINGNVNTQINVIRKLQEKCDEDLNYDLHKVINNLNFDNKSIGLILPYNSRNMFGLFNFFKETEICDIIFNFYEDYTFKGELTIKNNEIYLDKSIIDVLQKQHELEKNVNKYNI